MLKSEKQILKELTQMRNKLKENLPNNVHIALCGNCYYTDEMKKFQEDNFYPFCECKVRDKCGNKFYLSHNIMIFEEDKDYDSLTIIEKIGVNIIILRTIYRQYQKQLSELENLYNTVFSYVYNTLNLNRYYRRCRINEIKNYLQAIKDEINEFIIFCLYML